MSFLFFLWKNEDSKAGFNLSVTNTPESLPELRKKVKRSKKPFERFFEAAAISFVLLLLVSHYLFFNKKNIKLFINDRNNRIINYSTL